MEVGNASHTFMAGSWQFTQCPRMVQHMWLGLHVYVYIYEHIK